MINIYVLYNPKNLYFDSGKADNKAEPIVILFIVIFGIS